jgi:hypothetical protein
MFHGDASLSGITEKFWFRAHYHSLAERVVQELAQLFARRGTALLNPMIAC